MELIRSLLLHRLRPSPDYSWVGSCINSFVACSAFTHVTTYSLAKSPYATLYTGGSDGFVISTAAPIATGWSDPVPGRVFPPAVDQRFFTAHCMSGYVNNPLSSLNGYLSSYALSVDWRPDCLAKAHFSIHNFGPEGGQSDA
jgi:hypothetical protein